MDFAQILVAVLGIVVFAVIAGAVGQIMEGEIMGGCGLLVLGVVLMAVYFGGATLTDVDPVPFDLSDLRGAV